MTAVASASPRILILGAGQAGLEVALRLRHYGHRGAIVLAGAEAYAPYQRPPLSKAYLKGEMGPEALFLRDPAALQAEEIMFLPDACAVAIERGERCVHFADGARRDYDILILALGSRARRLTFAEQDRAGVHVLRSIADVDALRPALRAGRRLAVIGAGYIGLEVAAVARALGLAVTVLEAAERPLARVAHPDIAHFFRRLHESRGVSFEFGARLEALDGDPVGRVMRRDGSALDCDLVLMGVGGVAETALAAAAGLAVDNGILVDQAMRSSDPAVYAIGDCCRRPMPLYGDRLERLESVHNALETAKLAAFAIAGRAGATAPMIEAPWFWSDQFDVKLQIAGLAAGADRSERRIHDEGSFALFHYAGARLIAAECVNAPGEFLGAKKLITERLTVAPEILRDISQPMKEIIRGATAIAAKDEAPRN